MLAVYLGVDSFEGRSSLRTWLFHILLNRARTTAVHERRTTPAGDADLAGRFDTRGHWATPPDPWADEVTDRLAAERLVTEARRLVDELVTLYRRWRHDPGSG